MLSNLLLVMGMCFFFGGLRRDEQFFNVTVAQTAASLLALAIASNIIPTAFDISVTTSNDAALSAKISRGTSIILLFVYGSYLFFQLKTHNAMYMQESQKVPMRPKKHQPLKEGALKMGLAQAGGVSLAAGRFRPSTDGDGRPQDEIMDRPPNTANSGEEDDDDEPEEPQLTLLVALITLAASTVIIAFCAEAMVSSINGITGSVSAEFVGLILLPIVGNAAEHATAVTVAVKDKMDLAIGVAVGSSMQIALFVLPFIVVVGWGLDLDQMNLSFDGFQIAVLFVSVLLVNYLIGGESRSFFLSDLSLLSEWILRVPCGPCGFLADLEDSLRTSSCEEGFVCWRVGVGDDFADGVTNRWQVSLAGGRAAHEPLPHHRGHGVVLSQRTAGVGGRCWSVAAAQPRSGVVRSCIKKNH
jgi:Ca2+:H+ antiporter